MGTARAAEDWQVHGFVSQTLLAGAGYDYFGDSSDGSAEFSELGLNGSYRFSPELLVSAQTLFRRTGEVDDDGLRLDYGFLDYTLHSDIDSRAGLRLGRMKNPIGFFNETRAVAATRPGILMPHSVYLEGLGLRDFFLSADGLGGYVEFRTEGGNLFLELGVVVPSKLSKETKKAFFGGVSTPGDAYLQDAQVGRLLYEMGEGRVRLAATGIRVRNQYEPAVVDFLGSGGIDLDALILGAEYNAEHWSLTAEHVVRSLDSHGFGVLPPSHSNQQGYYIQGSYRFAPRWSAFLRYDAHFSEKGDRAGRRQALLTGQPAHRFFMKDWSVGLARQLSPGWLLRGEFHRVRGTALLPLIENPELLAGSPRDDWELFALELSFRF